MAKENLSNITTILSDRDTGLPYESIDVVLLYRTFYLVKDKQALLDKLDREIFATLEKARVLIEQWHKEYNQVRPHSALGY